MTIHAQLPVDILNARIAKIQSLLANTQAQAMLVSTNANLYYTSGRVFSGYAYIPVQGQPQYFVRRSVGLTGDNVHYIGKPEQIADILSQLGVELPANLGLELDLVAASMADRLMRAFPNVTISNCSAILRAARAVKDEYELDLLRKSGIKHAETYSHIKSLYHEGMSDLTLQIEIERISRLNGCLGQFRISGDSMEIFMGNTICGDNADNPAPYDFAMGGAGLNPTLPVGCDGTEIKPGMAIMVDVNGNYTGYMTDMTRVFSCGPLSDLAIKAHECSRRIVSELSQMGRPGVEAKALYERAVAIAQEEGLDAYFMGHKQKAGFVGHGVGVEINELPVLAPRSRDILAIGNAIAVEPKFVIPGVGAVGVENTYIVTENGMVSITNAPEEIISLAN